MKQSVLSIIVILFLKTTLSARQNQLVPAHYVGLGIGISFDRINDNNFSPLNQKGTSFFYSIFYERHSKDILKFNIKYGRSTLKSGSSQKLNTSYSRGSIGITYLKNISEQRQTTKVYIGGSYTLNLLYMDWYNQDAFSYTASHGLAINTAVSKQVTAKHYVESTISIPLVQFLSRPPYNGLDAFIIDNQDTPLKIIFNGKLSSFKAFKSINWNVNYRYGFSDRFNWKVDYDLHIQNLKTENAFRSLSNRISTSILYKF